MATHTADWASRMAALDVRLRPIAESPVDIGDPDWLRKLEAAVPAVDRAGVRDECEVLLRELVAAYERGDDATRQVIRQLFRDFPSFAWAATLPIDRSTAGGLKAHLIHFSMLDQGPDPRDAQLWLHGVLEAARVAGTPTDEALTQVAAMSNRSPVYSNWSSTQRMLLDAR
jgi:hypothetical protein